MFTPQQIEQISFNRATFGGYDMHSVDELLEPLTEDYITLYKENALLKSKMKVLVSKLEEYRNNENSMKDAIVNAQKTCDKMVKEAEAKCTKMLSDANAAAAENARNASSLIAAENQRVEEAKQAAAEFLESRGIENMRESYYAFSDGVCTINYAYEQDGVLCYPDLIKVSVALDDGSIVEYDASGFLMNHQDQRDLNAQKLTADQARESVSPALTPDEGRPALIPTAGLNEVLTYEFLCEGENGEQVLVYINADTGYEEQILILLRTDNGILTR